MEGVQFVWEVASKCKQPVAARVSVSYVCTCMCNSLHLILMMEGVVDAVGEIMSGIKLVVLHVGLMGIINE